MDPQSDSVSCRSGSPSLLSRNNSKNTNPINSNISNSMLSGTTIYHQVEIRPRDSFKFYIRADNPLETLHFSFYTRKKSVGFGLFYLYLPILSSKSSADDWEEMISMDLPLEKVKELIGSSRENVRLQRMGQEGPLARALSVNNKKNLLALDSIGGGGRSGSSENLFLNLDESNTQLSNNSLAQLKDSQKLKIGELIEIIPIKKYNSFEYTLEGSYTIPLAGTYVMLFDNSFSISTSKHLFYHGYLGTDIVPSPSATPLLLSSGQVGSLCAAGWISKRRSGMVRNWARRWVQLDSLGVLSYFEDRASPLRGSIFVPDCSLIIAKKSLKFSLDSGTQTFHLQAYSRDEFDFWIQVLSSFKHFGPPTTINFSHQLPSKPENPHETLRHSIEEAFKQVRERLDNFEMSATDETLMHFESIYELLRGVKESLYEHENDDVFSDVYEAADEEVFYDVEEVYVDDIEDPSYLSETSGPENDDVFEAAIEQEDLSGVTTLIPQMPQQRVDRTLTDWLLEANFKLPIDTTSIYRTNMPFPAPPINVSFSSVILKKSFPVALNEPVNLLQRLAEELEYSELLDKAAGLMDDPVEQLVHVTAFAVSGYASSVHRSERKPYNPVLGETFEYIRPDRGYRFISEKVSHQPVIVACHAESTKWRFWQDLQAETKLWVKSMLITPKGRVHLELLNEETGEVVASFSWSKVSGALRNIQSSRKTIENFGELIIKNRSAGLESRIVFKESGMFSNSGNEVNGGIYKIGSSSDALPVVRLSGRWDDMLCKEVRSKSDDLLQVIWKTNPLPSNYAQFFCLTSFAITLNDFPDLLRKVLPLNDSRYRPDQRMLESGMLDAADLEKQRIEQVQRDRRNSANPIVPLWFYFDRSSKTWKFNGKYWESRRKGFQNHNIPQLW